MDILFDENGFIIPYEPIEIDIKTFHEYFVFNTHRERLYENYLYFLQLLEKMSIGSFYQWIDGSFTTCSTHPRDIDLVSFVDSNFYRKFERQLANLSKEMKYNNRIDAYFEPIFPDNHFLSASTRYNKADWKRLYERDRQFRRKGFIQLNFNKNENIRN